MAVMAACPCPCLFGIVRQGKAHHKAAEIGIAKAQRAELVAVFGDLVGRVAAVIDEDFLGDDEERGWPS